MSRSTDSKDASADPAAGSYERSAAREHRRLDGMFETVLASLRSDDADGRAAGAAFAELRAALEAHIDQEDRLYYPAVRALRPVHTPVIEQLVDAHESFRAELDAVEAHLASGALDAAERTLAKFVEVFGLHEIAEERLLQSIDEEITQVLGAARS
jgi:hypothetical protein